MTDHTCDLCGKPAKVWMWGDEGTPGETWYCFECADDYEGVNDADQYARDQSCWYCNGTGLSMDGLCDCEHCDGTGYKWWEG